MACSPWGCGELDKTEQLRFHFHALGKEMATHSQCSCLENPRDGGAWWAAIYGVVPSRTRLKQLSSSSLEQIPKKTHLLRYFPGGSAAKSLLPMQRPGFNPRSGN